MSAIGSIQQGQAAEQAGNFNAQQLSNQAAQERRNASLREDQQREEARKTIGTQIAATAGSGVQLNGSASDLLRQSLFNAEMDSQTIRYEGESRARGLLNDASAARWEGKQKKKQGYLSAAGSLLSGASTGYGQGKTAGYWG